MAKKSEVIDEKTKVRLREFVRKCEIEDIRQLGGLFNQTLRDGELPDHLQTAIHAEGTVDPPTRMLIIRAEISLTGVYEGQKEGELPGIDVRAIFQATYEAHDVSGLPDKFIKGFASTVSMLHIWPYWREYVQATIGRMALPPLTIPLYKLEDITASLVTSSSQPAARKKMSKKAAGRKKK